MTRGGGHRPPPRVKPDAAPLPYFGGCRVAVNAAPP